MNFTILQFLILLTGTFMLIMLARKISVAYPILLVVAGLFISYIPGLPVISIDPQLIFLIFLPPLLYEAAWYTSWNDFWKWRRPIGLLAFGLVIFTSTVVAYSAVAIIPGFTLAAGFLLGGIISPPDAVAATAILKFVKVPKRITTILDGESLINDASSLIVLRFALLTVLTGKFSFYEAATSFFTVSFMGIIIGLLIAHILYLIHRFLPTTASVDAALTLASPYFMYLVAEQLHYSGVIAVVSGGLFLSYRSHEIFSDGNSRLQTVNVWATLILIFNGLVFILIGLELPTILKGLQGYSTPQAWKYGIIFSLIVIVVRMLWIYPGTFIPRWLFKSIREQEPHPGWKGSFIIGWAGMRGVVSLAAALSLPMVSSNGHPFPHRSLIIFITFTVILVTLVFQGLSLPLLIKTIRITEIDTAIPDDVQDSELKLRLYKVALRMLEEKYFLETENSELLRGFRKQLQNNEMHLLLEQSSKNILEDEKVDLLSYNRVLKDVYHAQRTELYKIRKERRYGDENIRRQEMLIDLAEIRTQA